MSEHRAAFLRVSGANVASNLLKILVEGTLGLTFGSVALTADAAHSLADLLASAVVLVWGRLAFDEPDDRHPHGHNRFEPLSALFVGGTLLLIGFKLLYDAVTTAATATEGHFGIVLLAGLAFALMNRLGTYWYTERVNETVKSGGLAALAADCKNDVYTTLAAVVGVVGMALGYSIFDPLAGGLVSLLVICQGIELSRENLAYLVDHAPSSDVQYEIKERIRGHPEVHGIHDFAAYYAGTSIEVEFHAEVDGRHTLAEAHDIETQLRQRLREQEAVEDVHVHLDPAGMGEWKEADETIISAQPSR